MVSTVKITTTVMGFSVGVSKGGTIKGTSLNIYGYSRKFEHWSYDRVAMRRKLECEFYQFYPDQEICFFPKYDLKEFCMFIKRNGFEYLIEEKVPVEGKIKPFHLLPHVTYKNDIQRNAVEYLCNENCGPIRALSLQTGGGKGQPLWSKVLTPNGWTTIGNLEIGDVVSTPDGGNANVVGVYPQGIKDVYRVEFEDGRVTFCDDSHLWKIHYVQWKDKWRILDLRTIISHMNENPTYRDRMYVPLIKSNNTLDIELPIDPYVLGVILGDGHISKYGVRISKPDEFIKNELKRLVPSYSRITEWNKDKMTYAITKQKIDSLNSNFRKDISNLGLDNTFSYTKFIPEIYMNASDQQKIALLQGLFDTDGYASKKGINRNGSINHKGIGRVDFCTTSQKMAKQVQELIWSLGGLCSISVKTPYYVHNGERRQGRTAYIVRPRMKDPSCLFRLPRKKERVTGEYQYSEHLKLRIKNIEYFGREETRCIAIDHPDHLYITDDYIVTHNTVSFIMALQKMQTRALVTMSSRLEQWVKEIKNYTTLDDDDIYTIRGLGSIAKLFSQIDKDIHPKIILASTKTMRLYIDYSATYRELPHPSQMCESLNLGVVATDEYHEHFFSNYLINLLANPKVFIPITATFIANDPFVRNIFDGMIPDKTKFTGGEYNKFVNVTSYTYEYGGAFIKPYHYTARGGYSQVKFEEYLLTKGRKLLERIVDDCIIPIVKEHYIDIKQPGEKFLFLCATKKFCDYLTGVFKRLFKDSKVSSFYSGNPVSILDHFDMILSTPGSAGTGRDIKGLRTCFVFENTASEVRNTQFLGRLRGPPQMLNEPEFVYLSLACIPQHVKYASMRAFLYGSKAKTLKHRRIT